MARTLEVASATPRAGRRFEPVQELLLHRDSLTAARGLPSAGREVLVVPEFAGPFGIPDFTVFVGDMERLKQRHALRIAPVTHEVETGIVSAAHVKRSSTAADLARVLGWPSEIIADRLPGLARRRVLVEVSAGRYVRPLPFQAGGRLYAVEAKVDDWRAALRQVRTYRVWADGYVLVMGPLSDRLQDALTAEVRHDRGGLMIAGRWIVRPHIGHVVPRRRLHAWEMFAAATQAGLEDPALAAPIHS